MSVSLVLEGGGMRGVYTAGVLDVFNENNIIFPVTYGISAGACNALSYISGQKGRNKSIYLDYSSDKRYLSASGYFTRGSIFGFDFIFGDIAETLLPFDYDTFFSNDMQLYVGATDCGTGKPVFFGKEDMDRRFEAVIASSSLPVVSRIVDLKGFRLLDGGISSSIPLQKAFDDGCDRAVVVLTRDRAYKKSSKPDFPAPLLRLKYRKYPELCKAIIDRPKQYNKERELCFSMEEQGKALLIAPSEPLAVGRYSSKKEELLSAYELGVNDAEKLLDSIRGFIDQVS